MGGRRIRGSLLLDSNCTTTSTISYHDVMPSDITGQSWRIEQRRREHRQPVTVSESRTHARASPAVDGRVSLSLLISVSLCLSVSPRIACGSGK